MTEHARICKRHQRACTVDARDRVVCPVGPHTLEEGQWAAGKVQAGQARITLEGEQLVHARAEGALRFASRDRAKAIAHLYGLSRTDHRLREALTEPLVEWACRQAVDRALGKAVPETPPARAPEIAAAEPARRGRPLGSKNKAREPRPDRARSDRGLQLVAQTNLRDLMGEPLASGKRLGDATGAEILEAAEACAHYARGSAVRARYLRLVAIAVPADRPARQVLTEAKLGGLYGQAEREMERLGELLSPRLPGERPAIGGSR